MDSCKYTKLPNLMREMSPLHIQDIDHELHTHLLHMNSTISLQ